jgi:RNA polymerase sigma factor (sigma-70 family)
MKEEEIIQLIQKGRIEKAFVKLYKLFPKVRSILKNHGASKDQSNDLFQDALVVLYQKLQQENFKIEVSIEAYLINTCKFMFLKSQKHQESFANLQEQIPDHSDLENILIEDRKMEIAQAAFEQLGTKCKEILMSFYFGKKSMLEIAKQFSFSSEQVAKTQKYKCLESARKNYTELMNH